MIDEPMERDAIERLLEFLDALYVWWCAWLARARATRRIRRQRRAPLRSTKADAKRRAHRYAEQLVGRELAWKRARKTLLRLEREGRALSLISTPAATSRAPSAATPSRSLRA